MLLIGVNENNRWLGSNWSLTYRVGWNEILKACAFASRDYGQFEILVDDVPVSVKSEEESMNLPEARKLTFRGISSMLKVPVMITLYNQTDVVAVNVAMVTEEFSKVDYESFNKSMAQYLNSIELAMYR